MTDVQLILHAIDPIIVLLALGIVAVVLSRQLGLSPIVGYLLLGLTLGTMSTQILHDSNTVQAMAELGVVLLLFDIGLHFSFSRIREEAANIFGFGSLQVLLAAIVLSGFGLLFGLPAGAATLVGTTLALSSTAVVARLIAERHQQNCPVGVTATAILIFQDIAAIAILIVATTIGSGHSVLPTIGIALVKAAIAFAIAAALARIVVSPMLMFIVRTKNEEVFTATVLLVALAASWTTAAMGLSMTLGAFLGGMILGDTPYRAVIQSEVRPFRGLLLGFFFISVGLAIDASTILRDWPLILGIAALIILAKAASNIAVSLVFRWSTPGSAQIGFLLAQGSEFAFVILSIPAVQNLLGPRIAAILIAAVALTLAATPTLAETGRNLAGRLRAKGKGASNVELISLGITASVLIFCMGTRGRTLADALTDFEISHLAVESDDRRLHVAIADGYDVMFGSMGDTRLWQPMFIEGRKLIALTEPRIEIAAEVMPTILHRYPNLPLLAAATNDDEVAQFTNIGLRAAKDSADDGVDFAVAALLELGVEEVSVSNWVFKRQNIAAPVRAVAA